MEGKTEALLFGTARRIRMHAAPLMVHQGFNAVRNINEFKCLGTYANSSLDLNSYFEISYK